MHCSARAQVYGIQPLGDESLDMARLEAGFLAPDVDFHGSLHTVERDHDHSPFELGLGWIVNFKKTHFTGRAALLAQKESGNYRRLVKLDIEGNKPAENSILYADKRCAKGNRLRQLRHVVAGGESQYCLRAGGGKVF